MKLNNLLDYKFKENCQPIMNFNLSYTAQILFLFQQDIKHIHLHAVGDDFDYIHTSSEEYYDRLSDDIDTLCELAIINNESVPNLSNIRSVIPQDVWSAYTEECVDLDKYIKYMTEKGKIVLDYLKSTTVLDEYRHSVNSIIEYWDKEILFKLEKTSIKLDNAVNNNGQPQNDTANDDSTYIDAYCLAVGEPTYETVEDIPYTEIYDAIQNTY